MDREKQFVLDIRERVKNFDAQGHRINTVPVKSYSNLYKILIAFRDFFQLFIRLFAHRSTIFNFIYTGEGICFEVNGKYTDRVLNSLSLENVIYINRGMDTLIHEIDGIKTYNIGGLIKILNTFYKLFYTPPYSVYKSYKKVNDSILSLVKEANVYSMLFYNLNGLSLVFSKHRKNFKLIEVQHGTIVNFPTYSVPVTIKVADIFYVKNRRTITYLQNHLCKNFNCEYYLLPQKDIARLRYDGLHILYASTVEFSGLHPVFMEFLKNTVNSKMNIYLRLHPRERDKEKLFEDQMRELDINYTFDTSKNWLESNLISNLIVVSPWSSVIEDAVDNGFIAIVLEELGAQRFDHLIDDKSTFYAPTVEVLEKIIANICADSK